jgi:hypothetical protein
MSKKLKLWIVVCIISAWYFSIFVTIQISKDIFVEKYVAKKRSEIWIDEKTMDWCVRNNSKDTISLYFNGLKIDLEPGDMRAAWYSKYMRPVQP